MPRFFAAVFGLFALLVLLAPGCTPGPAPKADGPAATPTVVTEDNSAEIPPTNDGPFLVTLSMADTYAPGEDQTTLVTMDYKGSEPVTALALQLKLPTGWQFKALVDGPKPAIEPKPGATDTLTLVWITAPAFPATLTCSVAVPAWAEGTFTLEAQAIYRTFGGELQSAVSAVQAKNAP